ncbi:hypothetical protein MTO96_047776 [Rhipicephalus appendiculatus]
MLLERRVGLAFRLLFVRAHVESRLFSLLYLLSTVAVEDLLLELLASVSARRCRWPLADGLRFDRRNLLALRSSASLRSDEELPLDRRRFLATRLFAVLRLEDVLVDDW